MTTHGISQQMALDPRVVEHVVEVALAEDLGGQIEISADITAEWAIGDDGGRTTSACILSRQRGVIAGLDVAMGVFSRLDDDIQLLPKVADGDTVDPEAIILEVSGNARALVVAERTALNFLQRLGGIATLTRQFVDAVDGTGAAITDTRKTTPGLRRLERHAVRCGGGRSHRFNLADAVLIKENHVAAAGGVVAAVRRARQGAARAGRDDTQIMCETETLDQVRELISTSEQQWPDRILLDNMTVETTQEAVALVREEAGQQIEIEATGGVDLASCRAIAETGVDLLSVGALTHSAPAIDLSLLFKDA
jgi:nicotinate-nucleotide pyrophosphorylase (carboxylating)